MYYKLLARSYGDQGQEAEAHRYMAEYYYANGQTRAAITQVRLAQKAKGLNFYLAAILDDRLNFFLNEEAERMRDQ
jgi:predicted Zn-dependent protease